MKDTDISFAFPNFDEANLLIKFDFKEKEIVFDDAVKEVYKAFREYAKQSHGTFEIDEEKKIIKVGFNIHYCYNGGCEIGIAYIPFEKG